MNIKQPLKINERDQSIEESDGRVFGIYGFANDYDKRMIAIEKMKYILKAIEFYEKYKDVLLEGPVEKRKPGRPKVHA